MQIVQRDMRMAKYYDDKKHYRAARQYYQEVARKFPDSPLAEQARLRLAEIVDEPDVPPERLAWFVDLFPESRERTRVARIPELQNQTRVAQTSNARPAAAADAAPASANSTR